MIDLHHRFKRDNGYSELEISQKRSALENVLIPELLETHIYRMQKAGFKHVNCLQQQLNFASLIAIK
jgi:tRNA (cmo5U34)-methyltransferase